MNNGRCKRNGMTLLEVVMVLMLLGIIATVVIRRYPATAANIITQTALLKAHLRYAQLRSINTSTQWGINFSNNTYWLFNMEDMNKPRRLPGEASAQLPVGSLHDISITLAGNANANSFYVIFDSLGRAGTNLSNGELLPSLSDLQIAVSDDVRRESRTIIITANTGFIP